MRAPDRIVVATLAMVFLAACGDVRSDTPTASRCGRPIHDASEVIPEAPRSRPELGQWHVDPVLGGCLARVSDRGSAPSLQANAGTQAWNVSGQRVLTRNGLVLDATSFALVSDTEISGGVWSSLERDRIYFVEENAILFQEIDVGVRTLLERFSSYRALAPLGDPVNDRVAVVGERAADGVFEVFVYDLQSGGRSPSAAGPVDEVMRATAPSWARVSPSGRYVVVQWPESGADVYDADMNRLGSVSSGYGAGDLALGSDGAEWFVTFSPAEHGPVLSRRRLPDGQEHEVVALDWFHNVRVSCTAPRSNRCVVTTHGDALGGWQPFENELFTVHIESGAVERLAHHHSDPGFISKQPVETCELGPDAVLPNASLDRTGSAVLFTSNWNAHCFGELYLIRR